MRRPALLTLVLCACLGVCSAAVAGGGSTIANAPQLPIGQTITGGGTCSGPTCDSHGEYSEYWRIFGSASDVLSLDYLGLAPTPDILVCIFKPSVTDATRPESTCFYQDEGIGSRNWVITLPTTGKWTLGIVGGGFASTLAYQLTAHIDHYTQVSLTTPGSVRHGGAVTYAGTVTGASGGKIALATRTPGQPGWKPLAQASIGASGSFKVRTKVAGAGTYHLKAVYKGDSSHLASSASIAFKVA